MLRGHRGCCSPGPASTGWFQSPGLRAPLAALPGHGAGSLQGNLNLNQLHGSVAAVVPTERLLGQLGTQFWGPPTHRRAPRAGWLEAAGSSVPRHGAELLLREGRSPWSTANCKPFQCLDLHNFSRNISCDAAVVAHRKDV